MATSSFDIPFKSPNIPAALKADTEIRFRCYKGISCFNACCKRADVTLAPYDILRLKRRLGMSSTEFLKEVTVPFQMDGDGLPGVKLKTADDGTCLQLNGEEGCGVYEDRPTVCRYYPVALLALREKGSSQAEERYSLVKEEHCKGHEEEREISVADYRAEQGCEHYDARNREWYQLLLKKKSAGPAVGRPPRPSLQLYFMASYDLDSPSRRSSSAMDSSAPMSSRTASTRRSRRMTRPCCGSPTSSCVRCCSASAPSKRSLTSGTNGSPSAGTSGTSASRRRSRAAWRMKTEVR